MVKIGVAAFVSLITITIASSYLFADSPEAYGFVMRMTGCVFAAAFLFCILKGLVLGFDSVAATASLSRVLGIDALIILTIFLISQMDACTSMLAGA
ncbi:MAG: hypothetical protein IJ111_10465 [Eggerthellaceae bacterium]|nr:hypothetical protein [Eggerthellaceae bacterium]